MKTVIRMIVIKVEIPCVEEWSCSAWSGWGVCTETGQSRTRTCLDENECETEINKPVETEVKSCLLDITPPVRSKGQPIGKCPKGTTQIDITLQTDENSICRYSKNARNINYMAVLVFPKCLDLRKNAYSRTTS